MDRNDPIDVSDAMRDPAWVPSDSDVLLIRRIRLDRIALLHGDKADPIRAAAWRELDWAIVDLCDLALAGNQEARGRLRAVIRGGLAATGAN